MVRYVCLLGALGLACGSEGSLVIGDDTGSVQPDPGGGSAGAPSAGTGGTNEAGAPGDGDPSAGGGGSPPDAPGSDVIDIDDGDFSAGTPPPTIGDMVPQIVNVTGPSAVTNGGTALLHVQLSPPVASPVFVIGLDGDSGYHTVTGTDPDGDGIYDISVQVAAEATQASLLLSVALIDAAGNVGPYSPIEIALVQSGTGDVKITLSWDRLHDLDLHVIEPNGEEVQYQNSSSLTGGELDLDSGANCEPSVANTENIFWPSQGAPAGDYVVTVHNYQQCSPGPIEFSVRVAYDNVVNTYRGSFAEGTAGEVVSADNVREVVRFRRGL